MDKVPTVKGALAAFILLAVTLDLGCLAQDCLSDCQNGGSCVYDASSVAVCNCTDPYYGETCQYRDSCQLFSPCQNNATCVHGSDGYTCVCLAGYSGSLCEDYDACVSSPCEMNRRCVNIWPDSFTCACGDGYYGPDCDLYNACHDEPCMNDGRCIHEENGTFTCNCDSPQTGYYGERCELYDECLMGGCQQEDPCLDAECDKATSRCVEDMNSHRGYRCSCYPGFYDEDCSSYDRCLLQPCWNGGTCETIEHSASYICHCPPGHEGKMCEISAKCKADTTVSIEGVIEWPVTPIGIEVTHACPTGEGTTNRTCRLEGEYPKWTFPNFSECSDTDLDSDTAWTFTSQLATTTDDAAEIEESELESAVELLSAISEFTYSNVTIARDMLRCVSNVLDVDSEVMAKSSADKNTSQNILSLLKMYGENAVLENTSFIEFREANIQLQIVEPDPSEVTDGLEFEEDGEAQTSMTITLPAELFTGKEKTRVRFTALQNGKLFQNTSNNRNQEVMYDGQKSQLDLDNQIIIGAEVTSRPVKGLQETVKYSLGIPQMGEIYRCVYWDENGGFWTPEGLETLPTRDENTTTIDCTSSHLTYFAVLLDTGFSNDLSLQHLLSLTIISYVGSIISMVGLLLTFLTYTIFRSLRKKSSGKILVNLCASLFFLNLVFILNGTGAMTGTDAGCRIAAILLHYFVLTTFFWMGAEAVSIYRSLVDVFQGNRTSYYVTKCAVFAWGCAAIPVGVTLAIDDTLYSRHETADICLLVQTNRIVYYLLYMAPCTAILLANLVVFVLVLRAVFACNTRVHHSSGKIRRTQVGCALSITFLLGLTWLFGFFAISEVTLPFQYVFCILNSMQGFFIFMFRCALYPEAVRSWKMCIRMRTCSVDRHISSSALQKHSLHKNQDHSSTSSRKSSKTKPSTKVTFASSSDSSKLSFRWLRRGTSKLNKTGYEEGYEPTEMNESRKSNNLDVPEFPFKVESAGEHSV